jgi:3',5'-cyclic AMP phosphodiesterase CpdA
LADPELAPQAQATTTTTGMAERSHSTTVRVLHLSDIHCGSPFVAEHVAAALDLARSQPWSAVVVSGDHSQRARLHEFRAAREILDQFAACAPLLTVPGNHDTAWWHAPFGFGDVARQHERYRAYINAEVEPTLRLPSLTIIGLNSAWGTCPPSLTWYPRDWRVKGGLMDEQLRDGQARLASASPNDLRILVAHHNVVKGRLSKRWGMSRPERVLDAIATMPVDVVCTGHDHEERVEVVARDHGRFLVSTANTLSNRMRGHRPSAVNVIEATMSAEAATISVTAWPYDHNARAFTAGAMTASMSRPRGTPAPR